MSSLNRPECFYGYATPECLCGACAFVRSLPERVEALSKSLVPGANWTEAVANVLCAVFVAGEDAYYEWTKYD